jgi:hypothetical protein
MSMSHAVESIELGIASGDVSRGRRSPLTFESAVCPLSRGPVEALDSQSTGESAMCAGPDM